MAANRKQSRKRAANDEWKQSERARQALVAANHALEVATAALTSLRTPLAITPEFQQTLLANLERARPAFSSATEAYTLPTLPADCWLIIMQLATGQRLLSTFGPGGIVQRGSPYYGASTLQFNSKEPIFASLHSLRLVSRSWRQMASSLVRAFTVKGGGKKVRYPADLAKTFPYAEVIHNQGTNDEYASFVDAIATEIRENHKRRNPHHIDGVCVVTNGFFTGRSLLNANGNPCQQYTHGHGLISATTTATACRDWLDIGSILRAAPNLRSLHVNDIFCYDKRQKPILIAASLEAIDASTRDHVQLHQFIHPDEAFIERLALFQKYFAKPFILHCTAGKLLAVKKLVPAEFNWTVLGDEVFYYHLRRSGLVEPVP